MFGYRVLGFGGFTGAASEGDWSPTITATNFTEKTATFSMGFDTDTYNSGSSFGSIDDATINGMVGSGGGGVVSLIRCNWLNWDGNPKTFGIKFSEAGAAESTQQTNWSSITITDAGGTSTQFNRADARTFNAARYIKSDGNNGTGAPNTKWNNQYEYSWYATTNPFGTTSNTTVTLSIVLT
jgi:hypothetical protein